MDAKRTRRLDDLATAFSSASASIDNSSVPSIYQMRNAYSTLLLRSVNELADTYRHQKRFSVLSVSHCCALAGLPLWIVDVRHDASHNGLPGLGVCRLGALESLRFWGGRYWDGMEGRIGGKTVVDIGGGNNGEASLYVGGHDEWQ